MAMRTDTLRDIGIQTIWEKAISDDLSLNSALREHGYTIRFLPQCCVGTYNQTNLQGLILWATRQITLTKVYMHRLWTYGLAAYGFFNFVTLLGFLTLFGGAFVSPVWLLPAILLFVPSLTGVYRNHQRAYTFKRAMPEFAEDFESNRLLDGVASLIAPWIMTYCIIRSALTNEIEWRGRKYQLVK